MMYAKRPIITEKTSRLCMKFDCSATHADGYSMRLVPITCQEPKLPCSGYLAQMHNPCGFSVITPEPPAHTTFDLMESREDGLLCSLIDANKVRNIKSGIYLAELLKDGKPVPGACFEVEVSHELARPKAVVTKDEPLCLDDCAVECEPESVTATERPEDRPLWEE